jgi:hypothetical protein
MDLSIFSNGLTTKAYQDATKKRSAKRRTNKDWLKSNKEKLSDMTKDIILNNIIRNNQTSIDGNSYFFRLLGLKNKTLSLPINEEITNVLPCNSYEVALLAFETTINLYENDADFQQEIDNQLQKQGAEIVPLEV